MAEFHTHRLRNTSIYHWDLLRELVRRDLKAQYEGTMLGFAWTLIMPFLQLGIFYFLFRIILQISVQRFTLFAFIGIIAYGWFQATLSNASTSTTRNRELILRPCFPGRILPLVAVTSRMLHFIFTLPLILLIVIIEERQLPATIFLLPIVIAIQFMLSLGLGYMVAILNIIFRDSHNILNVLLRLGFFLSPVFYEPKTVPQQYHWLYNLNPFVTLLQSYRDIIMSGIVSNWSALGFVAILSIVAVCAGYYMFQKQSHRFLEEL